MKILGRGVTQGLLVLCLLGLAIAGHAGEIRHSLDVTLDPARQQLEVVDRIELENTAGGELRFWLHAGLDPQPVEAGLNLKRLAGEAPPASRLSLEQYTLTLPAGAREFTLRYGGVIHHPLTAQGPEEARAFSESPGLIGAAGVYLGGDSFWYPVFDNHTLRFKLSLQLPEHWSSISQGERTRHELADGKRIDAWQSDTPQQEIYLIAGAYAEYTKPAGRVTAMALLRSPDPSLAQKYLDATERYLHMYEELIGPYPYTKFALVENFWETGYGMPSFTLLGSRVIRLPFILTSSYPHEILHNYWGNGVYVDYAGGNWAEGLTAYLADHLIKEQQGQAVEHRRAVLQKYADYVQTVRDFPLTEFRSRHSPATEAVGYGKTLMLFHMLRRELGDQAFIAGLQQLYRDYQFKTAGFKDVEHVFSTVAGRPLDDFFMQWVQRTGAPRLRISEARVIAEGSNYQLDAVIEQSQDGEPYTLSVPIAIAIEGQDKAELREVRIDQRRTPLSWTLPAKPWRLDVDPQFDVFRRLERNEIPPALSQVFGAPQGLIVLPSAAPATLKQAYETLAESWRARGLEVVYDKTLDSLPADRAVWLLGWQNRFRTQFNAVLEAYPVTADTASMTIHNDELHADTHAVVMVGRHPGNPDHAIAWIASNNPDALPGLARKLPHYGKYSYLAFTGDEPTNTVKGQWPVIDSPMSVMLSESASKAPPQLPAGKPLIEPAAEFSVERMMDDIRYLASAELEGRGLGSPGLDNAADYIARAFQQAGLEPLGNDYRQQWRTDVAGLGDNIRLQNILGVIPGQNPDWREQSVVIAAHYDHLGRGWPDVHQGDEGRIHFGADDNASGVAILLELARLLGPDWKPQRSVVFAAFTGEEAGRFGSRYYVEHAGAYPVAQSIGMVNLDTVGRLGKDPLLVLGAGSADEWPHIFRGVGFVTGVPIKTVEGEAIASSDQQSFHAAGVPAVHLVATPNSDYHRPTDTLDKIDGAGLLAVAKVLKETVEYLAGRTESMTNRLDTASTQSTRPTQGRKVTLGTVPDFAWQGEGVRITGVTHDTPAEAAGLQAGDILTAIDGEAVTNLRDFAARLRTLQAGDTITIEYIRDGRQQSARAQLIAR